MTMLEILDWAAKGLAVVASIFTAMGALILSRYNKRVDDLEDRIKGAETLGQQNQLGLQKGETSMAMLKTYVSENFANKTDIQQSLSRVHEKIEEGNRKTDQLGDNFGNKIDQLRRDVQSDIRATLASIKAS